MRPLWRVSWDDLLTWLERRETWMAWDPARIPDLALREWAAELRSGPGRWLTHTQVARQFCVDRETPGQSPGYPRSRRQPVAAAVAGAESGRGDRSAPIANLGAL